jgi:F420-dependent oxidoreductase-like protein
MVKFGLMTSECRIGPGGGNAWDSVLAQARAAEAAGFDSVWLPDHFMWDGSTGRAVGTPILEAYMALAGIAAGTERVNLGVLVTGAPYRNPALLVKMVTTLDVMSHGRAIFGIGAGWAKFEFDAYGWPFPDVSSRMRGLRDTVEIALAMWRSSPASYEGTVYSIRDARNEPPAVQQPHPPIMIGGGGERTTLRLAARYADLCNVSGDFDRVRHKYAVLREHCEAVGRPYDEVTRTLFTWFMVGRTETEAQAKRRYFENGDVPTFAGLIGTPEQTVERLRQYEALGVQEVYVAMRDAFELEPIRLFGETVIAALS